MTPPKKTRDPQKIPANCNCDATRHTQTSELRENGPDHTPAAAGVWSSKILLLPERVHTQKTPQPPEPCTKNRRWGVRRPRPKRVPHTCQSGIQIEAPEMTTATRPNDPPTMNCQAQPPVPHPPKRYHTPAQAGVWCY
ncbi:hypothetical protein BS47DRAFT_1368703 [Hydnum rufescens UP504]|uniref:Uncharacterized protein n=1 Tax=Hydnum rufescens UP504 TaxID=1448309 RepID=A0A9P6AFD5_9AGAM|nr:hypothetical protein BS47DRAFT_1368703 [Hydnum rufescens UP504]